jgi:hypothetical protein
MSDSTVTAGAVPAPPLSHQWIQSSGFDLAFFILAPVLTLPLIFGALYVSNAFALLGFVLAFAHYLSSFSFYFWDENQPRHRERWMAFFGGPVVITVVFCLLVLYRVPLIVQFVLFFWNAVHVARQSCGILSIYRHRAGVFDHSQKSISNGAILATNLWFCVWNIETHPEVQPVLAAVSPRLALMLWLGFGALSVAALLRAALGFVRRARAGSPPGLPETGILVASLALFHPYLWIPDSARATFAMLLAHYIQYLGLVWLLHRRKFPEAAGSRAQVFLQRLSADNGTIVMALACAGLGFFAAKEILTRVGYVALFEASYLLLAFIHFYIDGLFWAFKDPHVRRSMGPYLMQGSPAAAELR